LIVFSGVAYGVSNTHPDLLLSEDNLVVDSVNIKGVKSGVAEQLQDVLSLKAGEKVSITGVKSDLEAIAAWYKNNVSVEKEAWSGLELIVSRVTVTPDIEKLSAGRAMVTYDIKEWFPSEN
jgi:outer membrane protein assembly factor BamA